MSTAVQNVSSFEDLFSVLDLSELQRTADDHPETKDHIYRYIRARRDESIRSFFGDIERFWEVLSEAQGVISGSTALKLVLAQWTIGWDAKDLDVYVPKDRGLPVIGFLATKGYNSVGEVEERYGDLHDQAISTIRHMQKDDKHIDIIESVSDSAIAPILRFHSTTVMNFFTAQFCFCAYPGLTTHYRATINYGCVLQARPSQRGHLVLCWKKYEERGYRFDEVSSRSVAHEWGTTARIFEDGAYLSRHTCREDFECPHTIRSTTDDGCFWVDFGESENESEQHYASPSMDPMFWLLGGKPCGGRHYGTLRPFTSIHNIVLP
ncbi:hypothetical protein BJ138DRAFT_1117192 [Hygrophoropsis aurantiaca]|uniref:Uncharacterized protein n=1 Tax=Hygrophoropsis aurantiaca TaxID=72124 RepID=A0ACB8A1I3_9AGAM|nr:hypothetical protein BJ138DRAFT_1117192 [Hygrophoropsis aurantiaca]